MDESRHPLDDETGFAAELLERGLISRKALNRALAIQRRRGVSLIRVLEDMNAVEPRKLLEAAAGYFNVPYVDFDETFSDPMVLDLIGREKALEFRVIPLFDVEGSFSVAMADPYNLRKISELEFLTGKTILPVFALEHDLDRHLREFYGEADPLSGESQLVFQFAGDSSVVHLEEAEADRPIVRLVNLILIRAIQESASDIHMEPGRDEMGIRFRIDGILRQKSFRIPSASMSAVISRIKILAGIDISEKRIPQDGKIHILYRQRRIDVRVSTFPSIFGEKVVMRLLDKDRQQFSLENIGFSPGLRETWMQLLRRREGILLVTGPTGSGKSSTLFATLKYLNSPEVNIVTLEDPVEYELQGITQGQVNERAGFTFAAGLRSILRQDPDVILLGEIRDRETGQIAVQAAMTGHLVLSTLHTNDAPSAVTRLVDMGIPRFLVASGLIGVLAQRLVRRACPHCLEDIGRLSEESEILRPWLSSDLPLAEGKGCRHCGGTGYRGRLGVHELLVVDDEVRRLITAGRDDAEIAAKAPGYRRMWWDGIEKVRRRETTLSELLRHLQPDEFTTVERGEAGPS